MVRPLRIEFAGGLYHITSRGNRKEAIYLLDEDRQKFLSVLGDACTKYNWLCHSYCLMSNHYHLLIQQSGQKPGLGFPICRIVGVICLSSGAILNAAIGHYKGKGGSEQALLRQLLTTFNKGELVIGDALYSSYFLLSALFHLGIDVVFEQLGARKSTIDFNHGERLGINDHLITLTKPKRKPEWMTEDEYKSHPNSLLIREVKVAGKVLITNLTSPQDVAKADLKALYKKRWNVEVDLRNIKNTLGMGELRGFIPVSRT